MKTSRSLKLLSILTITFASAFLFTSCTTSGVLGLGRPVAAVSPITTPKPSSAPTAAPSVKPVNTAQPSSDSFRFIVMADSRGSDTGINAKIVKKTLEQIKKLSPQPVFAIMPGDLVDGAGSYTGVKKQLEYFKKTVTAYYPAEFFYPGLGNHETARKSGGEKAFGEVFKEFKATFLEKYGRTVYFFDYGNTRFFMLNSNYPGEAHKVSDTQLEWIRANAGNDKKHTLFFVHEPPYPTGSGVGSSLDSNRLQRNKLWDLVDSLPGPMLFNGHEHNYTRRHIDHTFNSTVSGTAFQYGKTVYQVTAGSFGAPLYKQYTSKKNVDVAPIPEYHYAVVDIADSRITVNVYNLDGKVLDSFSQKH